MKNWILGISLSLNVLATCLYLFCHRIGGECSAENNGPHRFDYESNAEFIDGVVGIYDRFIMSKTGDSLPVAEAYRKYFSESFASGDYMDNVEKLVPDSAFAFDWAHDLISGKSDGYLIYLSYYGPDSARTATDGEKNETPGYWTYTPHSDIWLLLNDIGKDSGFWEDVGESISVAGCFHPYYYGMIHSSHDKIDFSNKYERFVVALSYMDGCLGHRDFIPLIDVPKSDSIHRAGENRRASHNL